MTWTEIRRSNDLVNDAKAYAVERLKKIFMCLPSEETPTFILPDGTFMRVFSMHGKGFNCLGMEYGETSEVFPDDGDLYHIDDYDTPDEMFKAMLEETKRT